MPTKIEKLPAISEIIKNRQDISLNNITNHQVRRTYSHIDFLGEAKRVTLGA